MTNVRPIIFGEVLFDQFPDGSVVLGGAPFNVAWHLQAFGLSPLMISSTGDDTLGREIRNTMQKWGMDSSGMQMDAAHPTGTVAVNFSANGPCYDIREYSAYDFIDANAFPPLPENGIIYHGSLALRQHTSRNALQKLKQILPAPGFVDINLRAPWWTKTIIQNILEDACWLKLNEQEIVQILPGAENLQDKMKLLMQKYALHYLVVTQGGRGATAVTRAGEKYRTGKIETPVVIDTVGAGDAFSSVLILGLIKNWPVMETLIRARTFAGTIVKIRGATVNDKEFYQPFIDIWRLT